MESRSPDLTSIAIPNHEEKVAAYRNAILKVLSSHLQALSPDLQMVPVFDLQHDRYQLLEVGWQNRKRIFLPILHLDLIEGKVWIQQNQTDIEIGDELVAEGVERANVVLGFIPKHLRHFNPDYAVE
ncbi:XisI protein [Leptolyngbya sp. AN03gr2]|uniref:XisI protein n=1 Tax=unclassified Leptolyngbya TaxID=2650499 RepID=UPI003D317CC5